LEGSIIILLNKPKKLSTAIPSILNGSERSQKIGYIIKAKIASGQQKIKSIIQIINVNMFKDNYFVSLLKVK